MNSLEREMLKDQDQEGLRNSHVCCAKSLPSCLTLCDPMDYIALQAPLSMGFSRQECWSGLPCPPPRDRPTPGTGPGSSTLQVESLLSHQGSQKSSSVSY